jgi:hypothetical protein
MSIDLEYAVKKDIRNNPIVREVNAGERREMHRMVWLAALVVGATLFAAWPHFTMVRDGYSIERLRASLASERTMNRQLRLNLETLKAPQSLEARARALGLQPAASANTLVVERTHSETPHGTLVAQAR